MTTIREPSADGRGSYSSLAELIAGPRFPRSIVRPFRPSRARCPCARDRRAGSTRSRASRPGGPRKPLLSTRVHGLRKANRSIPDSRCVPFDTPHVEVLALHTVGRARRDEVEDPSLPRSTDRPPRRRRRTPEVPVGPALRAATADEDPPALEARRAANEIEIAVDGVESGVGLELRPRDPHGFQGATGPRASTTKTAGKSGIRAIGRPWILALGPPSPPAARPSGRAPRRGAPAEGSPRPPRRSGRRRRWRA